MGPYGLGRAPSPLMHTPSGCAYGCPAGAPIIGRDLFFFSSWSHVHSPSARYRLQCTTLWVVHMGHPKGCPIISRDLFNTCARVRVCACARGTCRNFGQNSRSLGQNYRHPFLAKIIFCCRLLRASMHCVHMGTPIGAPIFKKLKLINSRFWPKLPPICWFKELF